MVGDVELQPATRFEWERIVRRCLLPGPVKLVAYTLAQYGDRNGSGIRPGIPRLSATCAVSEKTARRHLDVLRGLGLVEKLTHGGGRDGKASTYRLTVPVDLMDRVPMLAPDEVTAPLYSGHLLTGVGDGTPDTPTPVTQETAVTGGYSGQTEPLLRSSEAPTPVTQVTTYQGDQPTTHQGDRSPEVSSSPTRGPTTDEIRPARPEIAAQAAALRASVRAHRSRTREDTPA